MNENLSINQVEKLTGVSKRNIRFYEKEGLLLPKRNEENGYRVYDENDIWRIKIIKMLRMLDMPLEEIQCVLDGDRALSEAIVEQQAELERKAKELQAAIHFCEEMKDVELNTLDVDGCLNHMESENGEGFFKLWVDDYKRVTEANRNMDFRFEADNLIITARDFTNELCAYANRENLNLVITKESLYPEFTIDGVEYTAMRYNARYGVVWVQCNRKNREIKGEGVTEERKILQWILHKYGWGIVGVILYCVIALPIMFADGLKVESVSLLLMLLALMGIRIYRDVVLHMNDKTK
jgi:DNA-binding transcriptional MerR regulator